jgi:signal recognition particle subunit SRP54
VVVRGPQQFDEKEAAELQKKIRKNKFDFNDFYSQIQQIKKMGNMKDLMGMIPGVGKMMKDVEVDDNAFKSIEAIIQSMTPFEKSNPETINQSRRTRIASGSGTDLAEVNRLMKQFDDMKKVMKQMSNPAAMASMMRRMPKM